MAPIAEAFVNVRARNTTLRRDLKQSVAITQRAAGAMRTALAGLGVTLGLAGTIGLMRKFSRAAREQEDSIRRVEAALAASGQEVKNNSQLLQSQASAIQRTTVYGDEFVLKLQAMSIGLGSTAKQATDTVKAAIGLAEVMGEDVNTNMVKYIELAREGRTEILRRWIPALEGVTDKTEQLAIIQRVANQGYAQAQLRARSQTSMLRRIGNEIGDVMERFGQLINTGLGGQAGLKLILRVFQFLNFSLTAANDKLKEMIDALRVKMVPIMTAAKVMFAQGLFFLDKLKGATKGQTLAELRAFITGLEIILGSGLTGPSLDGKGGVGGARKGIMRQMNFMPRENLNLRIKDGKVQNTVGQKIVATLKRIEDKLDSGVTAVVELA